MQTEPIGFLGTPAPFKKVEFWHKQFRIESQQGNDVLDGNKIGLARADANGKLFVAAKKMAVALQNNEIVLSDILSNYDNDTLSKENVLSIIHNIILQRIPKVLSESQQVLKEAGP